MKINLLEHVIISLTTISSRVYNVRKVIESLLLQSYPNFEIRLYISKEPNLIDKGIPVVPQDLKDLCSLSEQFNVFFTPNIGPYRKLIPVLKEFWGGDQLLVTVDDDVYYPKHFLSTLIIAEKIHRCPTAFRGRKAVVDSNGIKGYGKWLKVGMAGRDLLNVPTGKDGVLYRPSYFLKEVLNTDTALELAKTTDDLWFKWNTALNNYDSCLLLDSLSDSFANIVKEGEEGPSLFGEYNKHGKNDEVVARLESYYLEKYQSNLYDLTENRVVRPRF